MPPSPFINVRDRGAFGDGRHDDTSAIQSALTDAVSRSAPRRATARRRALAFDKKGR